MWSKTLLLLSKPCSFNSQWTCKDTQCDKEAVVPGKRNVGHSFRRWKTCTVLQMTHNHLGFCSLLQLKSLYNLNLKWFIYMKIHCTNRRISILLLFFSLLQLFCFSTLAFLHPPSYSQSLHDILCCCFLDLQILERILAHPQTNILIYIWTWAATAAWTEDPSSQSFACIGHCH